MTWGLVAVGGATLASGYLAKEGAEAGADASGAATAEERRQFDLTWDANEDFRTAGRGAVNRLDNMLTGGFTAEEIMRKDPGYKWRLQQGTEGVENMLSGQNRRLGGSGLKAMADYQQGSASQEWNNIFNRNSMVAGYGPQANQTPQNQISTGIMNQGMANAGKYSAYNNALQGGIQNYLTYDAQQNSQFTPSAGYAPDWVSDDPSVWG